MKHESLPDWWPEIIPMRKRKPVYIRAGLWSGREPSMNHSTSEYERGTSVYPAKLTDDGYAELDLDDPWMEWHKMDLDMLCDRLWWVVTGREICRGSDGEPVLQNSSVVARPLAIAINVKEP